MAICEKLTLLLVLCFLGYSNFTSAQTNLSDLSKWESTDLNLKDDLHFHKITSTKNALWAIDYGGGNIYKSTDGQAWTPVKWTGSSYTEGIQFVNDSTGFVCGDYGFVLKTTDTGKSWKEVSPEFENRITKWFESDLPQEQLPDGNMMYYYKLEFTNEHNGYMWGFSRNPKKAKGFGDMKRMYLYTGDGGDRWTIIKDTTQQKKISSLFDESYWDDEFGWQTKNDRKLGNVFQYTENGGESFSPKNVLPDVGLERWFLRDAIFWNRKEGMIFGGGNFDKEQKAIIMYTSNGGKDWKIIENDWPHIHDAVLFENQIYFVGKEGKVFISPVVSLD